MKLKSLTRRAVLMATGTSAAAIFAAPALAQTPSETFRWKMVTTWPKNFPGLGTGAQRIADSIDAMSAGRLHVELYAAGKLVPPFEVFDAVREGVAEMSHDAAYYWVDKNKSTPFFTTVPAGLTAMEHNAWIHYGGGQELWDELYAEFGLGAFLAGNLGVQMGGWFRKEINSVDDLEGLRMRIPGLGAEVISRMGAIAVNLPAGEIMSALESGLLDATEWAGPWNDLAFGFHKIAKYYYGPGFHEPGAAIECMVNLKAWQALPRDLQEIVKAACAAENERMPAQYLASDSASQTILVEKYGVDIRHFPDDVVNEAYRLSEDVIAETAQHGDINRRIFDSWWKFRRDAIQRGPYAEQGFMNARARRLA